MPKTRQASSSQQQRRAAKARLQDGDEQQSSGEASQPAKSFIVLRSSLPSGSFLPAVFVQLLAVAYCIVLLHGRPSSLVHSSALLRPLIYSTNTSLLKMGAGLLLVQLYFAIQLKLWSDRAEKPSVPTASSEGLQEDQQQAVSLKSEIPSLHKLLLKVDLSRLDLSSVPETLASIALAALCIFILALLMGAPVARLVPETALFSCFLAILAFTAPLHVLRSPFGQAPTKASVRSKWSRLFAAFQPRSDIEIALLLPAYGAIIGSMLGVIPEGLDWEEPWQKWPVPCVLSAFVGWTLGQLATLGMCSILWLARAGSQKRMSKGELQTKTE